MFNDLQLRETGEVSQPLGRTARLCVALAVALFCTALMAALLSVPKAPPHLAELAHAHLGLSGVENPVTAVLLNFRSYDTLLEIAVLLIVAIAVAPQPSAELPSRQHFIEVDERVAISSVLAGLLRWLVPLALIVGGYLLWIGAYHPGGAFQAGAVIAGAGVALCLGGQHHFNWRTGLARLSLLLGLAVFTGVGLLNLFWMGNLLRYPLELAGAMILFIELAATLSIAATLLLLFCQLREGVVINAERRA